MILNPATQIQKGQDAKREHDLKQIATGLDSYFNDNNYYPRGDLSVLVSTKDIQIMPSDPTADAGHNYAYIYDGEANNSANATPQWNVLFAKLAVPASSNSSFSCPLEQMKDSNSNMCVPKNYLSLGYNYCVISGNVNCDMVTATTIIPLPIMQGGGSTPTPTSFQGQCVCGSAGFYKDPNIIDPNHQCQIRALNDSKPNSTLYCDLNCQQLCTP